VITWNFDDGNGNSIDVTQNVVIIDATPPVAPVLADVTGECSATAVAPTTTDACEGSITGTTSDPLTYNTQGTHVITWNFDDGNGNSIDVTQNVVIIDVTPPVAPLLADVTGECSATAVAPTTTDACEGSITGTTSDPLTYNTQGTHVITWNFDDGNGNSIDVTQNVVIIDATPPVAPVLTDVTGECSATATAPTTTDDCSGTITGTTTDPLTYSTEGTHVITWNFDDGNGNSIDVTQNVIVEDVTAPTATCPSDVVTCDGQVTSIGLTDLYDNCSTPVVTYELSGSTTGAGSGDAGMEIFNPGATTVTYTFVDESGNSGQCQFTVTYETVEAIVVTHVDRTLTVETAGSYQWIDCTDNSILAGETRGSFTPTESGEYAVIVTQGTCSDTSECYTVDFTGIDMNGMLLGVEVYPNPADRFLTVSMESKHTNVSIKVVNTMGQLVLVEEMEELDKTILDISRFKPGVYLISIKSDQLEKIVRIIKK